MKQLVSVILFACIFTFSSSMASLAQEVELPIKWTGSGKAMVLMEEGLENVPIDIEFNIDEDGYVTGSVATEDGKATLKKFYYTGLNDGARKLMLVLVAEDADEPFIVLMDSRVLHGKFLYGEIFLKKYEKEGSVEKSLYLSDSSATEFFPDYISSSLKNLQKASKPMGVFSSVGEIQ